MIKLWLKHKIVEQFINSVFDGLINIFGEKRLPKINQTYSYLKIITEYTEITHEITYYDIYNINYGTITDMNVIVFNASNSKHVIKYHNRDIFYSLKRYYYSQPKYMFNSIDKTMNYYETSTEICCVCIDHIVDFG